MTDNQSVYYERRLQHEIEDIEARIKALTEEKYALQRQLMKARQEGSGLGDVNRKNSIARVMIENRIAEALRGATRPLTSRELLREARFVNFELKETTFRTHLHRMKKRGVIMSGVRNGLWQLARSPAATPGSEPTPT